MSSHSVRRAESVQDRIAKATLRLLAQRGAGEVTPAEVVNAAGICPATMARYCPTEDDLWRTTAQFVERRMTVSWDATVSESPAERLRSLLALQIGLIMSIPALREMLLSVGLRGSNRELRRGLCRVRRHFRALLADTFRDGTRAHQFPQSLDPEDAARHLTETLQGVVVSWSLDARREDVMEEAWIRLDAVLGATVLRTSVIGAGAGACDNTRGA